MKNKKKGLIRSFSFIESGLEFFNKFKFLFKLRMISKTTIWTMNLTAIIMFSTISATPIHQFIFIEFKTAHSAFHKNTFIEKKNKLKN